MDNQESSSSTPKANAQFGVLDLLLLTLSIAYVCGLVMLGQSTEVGTALIEGPARAHMLIVAAGLFSLFLGMPGAITLLVVTIASPRLAPRLFLLMNLATVLAYYLFMLVPQSQYDVIAIGGSVSYGVILLLPAWVAHRVHVGHPMIPKAWWMLVCAGLINACLIASLCSFWVFASI